MAIWCHLNVNQQRIGCAEIRRREHLDLTDPAAIQDAVNTYDVYLDGNHLGDVRHRYGDGAWRLLALAADLIASDSGPHPGGDRG